MSNWLCSVFPLLESQNYQEIIDIYEEEIESNPDNVNNYWYLGLAYLLNGDETEAQTTWFYILNQLDDSEISIYQEELLTILNEEAEKLKANQYYFLAYLVCFHIQQINPLDLHNLLSLLSLSFLNNSFNLQLLKDFDLFKILSENFLSESDYELLWDVLMNILHYPSEDSLIFLKICLDKVKDNQEFINNNLTKVIEVARVYGYKEFKVLYAAEMFAECLKYDPENLELLINVFSSYKNANQWEKSLSYYSLFDRFCHHSLEKLYSIYLLLNIYLAMSDWEKVNQYTSVYMDLLIKVKEEKVSIGDTFLKNRRSTMTQNIFYLEDNPQKNRPLINFLSELYQNNARELYCCPVPINSSIITKRKIKIGYLGNTFRTHSVGFLCRWLINHHNLEEFEIYLYLINQKEDDITQQWFKKSVYKYRYLTDNISEIITQIEKDQVDILVDLDSLTYNTSNMIMALKPAPIQVTWLGLDASGIPAIDYFIADPYVLPENAQEYYAEKIWRLPKVYLGVDGFEVGITNISRADWNIPEDAIIYLNMQNASKRHPQTIHLQMKIIKNVANSYLLIKGSGNQETLKKQVMDIARQEGVREDQLFFLERSPTEAIHRANIKIADVVLDTYPYNGATTTLETLWMEVPLVTRVGEQFAARNSYTFMINAGVTEGIAWSDEEYIEWGIKLGTDENLRKEVSWKLKQSKKTSPLWNGKQFTKEMEKAYRQMWEIYVGQQTKIES